MNFPRWNTADVGRSATTPLGYVTATFKSDNMSNPGEQKLMFGCSEQNGPPFTQSDYQVPVTGE